MGQTLSRILGEPYTAIAPYYDLLMKDVNYGKWLWYIDELFKRSGHQPRTILDLACGTGTCSVLLAKQGYRVTGLDSSEAMLRVAKEKAKTERVRVTFTHQRMEDFFLPRTVDAIISLFDSVNYVLEEEEMLNVYRCANDTLAEGGLLIFDMNTEYGLAEGWGDPEFVKEEEGIVSIWRNEYDRAGKMARLTLTLFVREEDHYLRIDEVHLERAYTFRKVKGLLTRAGFTDIHAYKHLTFKPLDSMAKRAMVVAKKATVGSPKSGKCGEGGDNLLR
jgi:ubiquinone/menaquinone biosynthesis C-methylase UbiE